MQAKLAKLNPAAEVSDPYAFKIDESVDESKILKLDKDEKTEEGKSQEDQQKMVTMEVDQQRYRDFMRLLHKCSDENEQARSMNIEFLRNFCSKLEEKNLFSNKEIDENKVMRSEDIVFMI